MAELARDNRLPTGKILCLLGVYFLVHIVIRVTVSDSLELDEAEQLVLGQTLSWGYGTKPPLYSWLQIGFFRLFGERVLALSLLKNLLLFSTYICTFLAARKVTDRTETALIATLSLQMIPQIAWESQRDLTHSVLATTVAALTLYLFLRLCEERRTFLYLAFGAVVGLGFLAKFNVIILPVALVVAGVITGIMIGIETSTVFAHDPDFEVRTPKDIVKFCEFFYDEYVFMGVETLTETHQNYPNLRACVILYEHIAWKSTHPARDIVLIAEIEKYLGDAGYIRERHIEKLDTTPEWVKSDAKMWVDGKITDMSFGFEIRTMMERHILNPSLNNTGKDCNENKLCFVKSDFMEYSYSDRYGQDITEKYTVDSFGDEGILMEVEKISRDGKKVSSINMDNDGIILEEDKCCMLKKFIFLTSINFGDMITPDLKVMRPNLLAVLGPSGENSMPCVRKGRLSSLGRRRRVTIN